MRYLGAWSDLKPAWHALPIRVLVLLLVCTLASPPSKVMGQSLQEICEPDQDGAWTALCRDTRILSLWVDPGRVVWIGTDIGLRRYGGRAPADEMIQASGDPRAPILESLSDEEEEIEAVLLDSKGSLWIGTHSGLLRIDDDGDQFTFTEDNSNLPSSWITALAASVSTADAQGIWIGTLQGYAYFNGEDVDPQPAELPRGVLGPVHAIIPHEFGGAYVAVNDKVLFTDTNNDISVFGTAEGLQGGRVNALARSSGGVLWAGTETGLYRSIGQGFRRIFLSGSAQEREAEILAVANDGRGGLWLGTPGGLLHFNGKLVDDQKTTFDGLPHNRVSIIHRMENGTLWIGTAGGLARWNPDRWRTYPMTLGAHTRFIVGYDNQLWATTSAGLFHWDDERWEIVSEMPHYGLWADSTTVWSGSQSGLQNLRFDMPPIELPNATPRVVDGESNDLWIGSDSGLFRVRGAEVVNEFYAESTIGLPGDFYNALHVSEDRIWVGTQSGLAVGDGETWNLIERGDPRQNKVNAIAQDPERGTIWVGTAGGLWQLSAGQPPQDPDSWISYGVEDGLPTSVVNAIWVDHGGPVWLGTDGGLSALEDNGTEDNKEDDVWVTFTTAEGMGHDNRVTALWRDDQGRLWIGTRSGILSHMPISQQPLLKIGGIRTGGQLLPAVQGLTLEWNQREPFVVFDGRSLDTERLIYRSNFSTMEEPWNVASRNERQFTNLEPGERYTFRVQAFDMDLNTTEQIAGEFSLEATPPYARTEIQILAVAAVVGAVLYAPAARAWRVYNRPSFREIWEIEVVRNDEVNSPDAYRYEVITRLTYVRDLRLLVEGRIGGFLHPVQGEKWSASKLIAKEQMSINQKKLALSDTADQTEDRILASEFRKQLADMLMPKPLIEHIQRVTAQEDYLLRLRLNLAGAPELATFPWEAAQMSNMEPLGMNPATSISRFLPWDETSASEGDPPSADRLDRKKPLSVLLVVSSPEDIGVEQIDKHAERVNLSGALDDRNASVRPLDQDIDPSTGNPTKSQLKALSLELMDGADVIHFLGHYGPNPAPFRQGEPALLTEDPNGDLYPTFGDDLVQMIAGSHDSKKGARLLVLNACQSGKLEHRGRETLAGLVPDLMTNTGLLAIVAMQYPVRLEALRKFTSSFYTALVGKKEKRQVDYAVSVARRALNHESGRLDWAAPVVYMRVADGMIYEP